LTEDYPQRQLATIEELERNFREGKSPSTIVPFVNDPTEDPRLCVTIVAFLPSHLATRLQHHLIAPMKMLDPNQYFYPSESMHITMQNVRSIADPPTFSEDDIETARSVVGEVVARHNAISLQLQRLFELPTSLAICAFSNDNLAELVQGLRGGLAEAGLPDNKQYADGALFGNCTFSRFSQQPNEKMNWLISLQKNFVLGEMLIDELALITTNAVCHKDKTRVIERYRLPLKLSCKQLVHNSADYEKTVLLRDIVLRRPLGLSFKPEDLASENESFHLACYADGLLFACLVLKPLEDGCVQMRQVAVAASAQGRGVGKALVLYAEAFARSKGFREMYLHARESAVPFYLKLSYATEGEPFEEVSIPHMAMRKVL